MEANARETCRGKLMFTKGKKIRGWVPRARGQRKQISGGEVQGAGGVRKMSSGKDDPAGEGEEREIQGEEG